MDSVFLVHYVSGYGEDASRGDVCVCRTEEAARAKVLELQENFPKLYERIEQAREWEVSPSKIEEANRLPTRQDYYEWRKKEIMSRFGVSDSEMCMDMDTRYMYKPLRFF